MRRSGVIVVGAVMAALGVAAPIAGALWYSWQVTVDWEHDKLRDVAERARTRAERSIAEVTATLSAANGLDNNQPCSPTHIDALQLLAFDSRAVEEVGYFEGGRLRCTSWGLVEFFIPHLEEFDFVTPGGLSVTTRMNPLVTGGKEMVAFEQGAYNALVNPTRFVDVIADGHTTITVAAPDGQIVSTLHEPDPAVSARVIADVASGVTDSDVYTRSRFDDWIVVVTEPRSELDDRLAAQRRVLLPAAAVLAVLPVGVAIWFSRRRLSLGVELAKAVRQQEFVVHYQPMVEMSSGRCIGAEALIRWKRPDRAQVSPEVFVPLAEQAGLMNEITDQVIESVGRDLGAFLVANESFHVAINLCAGDVQSGRALDVVGRMVRHYGIRPQQLWLEMTEQGFVDIDAATPHLERARAAGYKVAIDDFGTGYSSLAHVQQLPLDILKIDKAFIDAIATDSATSSVTSHIINMAQELDLKVIAEGVHTPQQADYLKQRGVDYAQGWLYAPALEPAELMSFCRNEAVDSSASPVGAV